jgi:hypothetical protein
VSYRCHKLDISIFTTEQIKFVCIGGDLIDGIGIFPNQEKELIEMDTSKQMSHVVDLFAKIPQHIKKRFFLPGIRAFQVIVIISITFKGTTALIQSSRFQYFERGSLL